jgi:hypothetical protein
MEFKSSGGSNIEVVDLDDAESPLMSDVEPTEYDFVVPKFDSTEKDPKKRIFSVAQEVDAGVPGVYVDDVGLLRYPLSTDFIRLLIKKSITLSASTNPSLWQLPPSLIMLTNQAWETSRLTPFVNSLKEKNPTISGDITAKLHQMHIQGQGDKNILMNIENNSQILAYLIVLCPSYYEGGEFVIFNDSDSQTYDFGIQKQWSFHFIAFEPSCKCLFKPILDSGGYRVSLLFKIVPKVEEDSILIQPTSMNDSQAIHDEDNSSDQDTQPKKVEQVALSLNKPKRKLPSSPAQADPKISKTDQDQEQDFIPLLSDPEDTDADPKPQLPIALYKDSALEGGPLAPKPTISISLLEDDEDYPIPPPPSNPAYDPENDLEDEVPSSQFILTNTPEHPEPVKFFIRTRVCNMYLVDRSLNVDFNWELTNLIEVGDIKNGNEWKEFFYCRFGDVSQMRWLTLEEFKKFKNWTAELHDWEDYFVKWKSFRQLPPSDK